MPTVREIAEYAGVSKSTVSLVLNNKPGVSEDMRRSVLAAVQQLEALQVSSIQATMPVSLPDANAGRSNGVQMLSVVVLHPPVLRSSYVFSEVLQGIQSAAQTYNVQLRLVTNDINAVEGHVSHLYFSDPNLRPDGVLVFGAQQHEPLLNTAYELGIPCVVLGRDAQKYEVSGLGRDEARYAYEAARYLIDLEHRGIAFVGGEVVYDYWHTRLAGYQHALEQAGIAPLDRWVQTGDGESATRTILEQSKDVTAIIYVNDTCAACGLEVIDECGLRVPDDLSVISFDDTDFAQHYDPPLTSVSYHRYEEGQWALKMLIDQIRYPYVEKVQVMFHAELIKRASCAPPRSRS